MNKNSIKKLVYFIGLVGCIECTAGFTKPFRVVIDPGHGGSDHGTVYDNGSMRVAEKDVTLTLSRQVAQKLRKLGHTVMLTRNKDYEVPLPERTALANRMKADVFLSIHLNSTATPMVSDTEGFETYILNNATDASSRRLAHFENTIVAPHLTDSPEKMDVALILKDLRLDANLAESKRLACAIQGSLVSKMQHKNRGVKQALFHVLLGADMPSALVEAGFLTSPRDRKLVLTLEGQETISGNIARAVDQFKRTKDSSLLSRCKVN